jgi:plastocyanin
MLFAAVTAGLVVPWLRAAHAEPASVRERNCAFVPSQPPAPVFAGESVTWTYAETGTGPCAGRNHRVQVWEGPEGFDSSPSCADEFSFDLSCMNNTPGKRRTSSHVFDAVGSYKYRCAFHGDLSGGGCDGMCGIFFVVAPASTSPSPSPSPTIGPKPKATATATATVTPTPSVSPAATPSGTLAAGESSGGGGLSGAARALISVGAVAALGALSFVVWRVFIA